MRFRGRVSSPGMTPPAQEPVAPRAVGERRWPLDVGGCGILYKGLDINGERYCQRGTGVAQSASPDVAPDPCLAFHNATNTIHDRYITLVRDARGICVLTQRTPRIFIFIFALYRGISSSPIYFYTLSCAGCPRDLHDVVGTLRLRPGIEGRDMSDDRFTHPAGDINTH